MGHTPNRGGCRQETATYFTSGRIAPAQTSRPIPNGKNLRATDFPTVPPNRLHGRSNGSRTRPNPSSDSNDFCMKTAERQPDRKGGLSPTTHSIRQGPPSLGRLGLRRDNRPAPRRAKSRRFQSFPYPVVSKAFHGSWKIPGKLPDRFEDFPEAIRRQSRRTDPIPFGVSPAPFFQAMDTDSRRSARTKRSASDRRPETRVEA
jgi:hypothetical protein